MPFVGKPIDIQVDRRDELALVSIKNNTARLAKIEVRGTDRGTVVAFVGGNDTFRGAYAPSSVEVVVVEMVTPNAKV